MSGARGSEPGIDIVTFGCRLNAYESEVMRREAHAAGLDALEGGAIIVNTCAVTGEAVRQARQAIRKARRENPGARPEANSDPGLAVLVSRSFCEQNPFWGKQIRSLDVINPVGRTE